ncbi:hypothetical protein NQ318_013922 [Aromia moschata]|uniref:Uncharacterized protein n=1 Tax=Aromia moschata TaxID=1265417 RepID=A0AAV8Z9P5_9CUCU|nr:hypothetical protein NQ318_013922 [Aromia moschata]
MHHVLSSPPRRAGSRESLVVEQQRFEYFGQCDFTLISPKKVINPYRARMENHVPQKPFGSFYQRCAACLAVANQIGRIIESVTQDSNTIVKDQESVNEDIAKNIGDLCSKGFKNYDLRKYDDTNLVTDNFKCTEHVGSNMDGNWTKKGTGIFRDCLNVEENLPIESIQQLGECSHNCKCMHMNDVDDDADE